VARSLGQGVKEFKEEANTPADSLAASSAAESVNAAPGAQRSQVRADEI
jgi:Sec-independent protein translocase protein TatA